MDEIVFAFCHRDHAGKYSLGFAYRDDADPAYPDPKTIVIDTKQFLPTNEDNALLLQKVLALQVDARRFEKLGEYWHLKA